LKIKIKRKMIKEKLIDRKEGEKIAILNFLEKNWMTKKRIKLRKLKKSP